MISRQILLLSLIFFAFKPVYAGTDSLPQPKLVVVITVDPLSPSWIDRYDESLSPGGIKRLFAEGFSCLNASVGHALPSRASALATLSTGVPPSIHGIIGESWYDRLKKEEIFSTEDYLAQPIGSSGHRSKHSAKHFLTTTLADKIAMNQLGKVISVSLEPDGAILSAGHLSHGSYWFDTYSGNWISNKTIISKLPEWVIDFNNRNHPDQYTNQEWDLILPESAYVLAEPDNNQFEVGMYGDRISFPYRIKRMTRQATQGQYEVLSNTPFGNTLTGDFSIAALYNEQLGLDDETDYLAITFTALHQIHKNYGYESREFMDALVRLDMEIQHLLYVIGEQVGQENCLLVFTATHGGSWNADMAKDRNLPAGRFRARNAMALLNSFLSAIHGENYWVESYINQHIYLDQTHIDQQGIPIAQIQEQAARFMRQFEGVAQAYPADRMISAMISHPEGSIIQNAFHSNRSGDILLELQPGWIQDGNSISDHLSTYHYDQHIPLVFWGRNISAGESNQAIDLQSIIPTICLYTNWTLPNASLVSPIKFD